MQAKIIDIGCGQGQLLAYLNARGYEDLTGIDLSEGQLEIAKSKLPSEIIICLAEATEFLSSKQNSYDMLFLFDIIEHFPKEKTKQILKIIYDSMSPNGRMIIRTPNMANPLGIYSRYNDLTHETGFTEYSLLQRIEEMGFQNIKFIPASPTQLKHKKAAECRSVPRPLRGGRRLLGLC